MRAHTLSRLALACGAALMLAALGLTLGAAPGAASAQTLPPRPTPAPDAPPDAGDESGSPAAAPGRITGTVIDQRSGAPAPGIMVRVGEATLPSDANGNYDVSGLAPGSYRVALLLAEGQGVAAQAELTVALAAGQTVVQHLFFSSPAPATPEPAPPPAAVPAALPDTGAGDDAGAALQLLALAGMLLMLGLSVRRSAAAPGARRRPGSRRRL